MAQRPPLMFSSGTKGILERQRKKYSADQGQCECSCVQWFLPGEKARRPKHCKNDSSCGSSGLLGIRKRHKSQERDCLCKIPSLHLQTPEVQMHFVMGQKNKQASWVHLSTRLKCYNSVVCPPVRLPNIIPNPQFATIFYKLICIVKNSTYFSR